MSAKRSVARVLAECRRASAVAHFSAAAGGPAAALRPAAAVKEATQAPRAAPATVADLSDEAVLHLLLSGTLSPHRLEADLDDVARAVHLRRLYTAQALRQAPAQTRIPAEADRALAGLPLAAFDTAAFYKSILNTNCEAVIGYVPMPVGIVGPLLMDGKEYRVPLATTEGALVASTNRGCAAIRRAGGAVTAVAANGMTRAPLVRMPSLQEAAALKVWVENSANFAELAAAFNSTSRFGRLQKVNAVTAGHNVFLRFKASTGDAMGMNMITKGCSEALNHLHRKFPAMKVLSLSGNYCTDKKPSAINWIDGRGKSVAAEVRLSGHVLRSVLKTSAAAMVDLNTTKNLVGSALAGSVGGFNAHASNIVTALFLATGQDGAQNVESSNCLTLMEVDASIRDAADPDGKAGPGLAVSVTMPSVEVGTVGGGTSLPAQAACLDLLGLRGAHAAQPGTNAETLARLVASTVLAGELSLMSALTSNDLLSSHMKLNRKQQHGNGAPVSGAAAVTPAMLTRLAELEVRAAAEAGNRGLPEGGPQPATRGDHSASSVSSPRGSYTTTYTPAGAGAAASTLHAATPSAAVAGANYAATSTVGHVPGGAPAGAHPHPLHLTSSAATAVPSSAVSPGRRYFAAPMRAHVVHARQAAPAWSSAADGETAWHAPVSASPAQEDAADDEPCLPVP